MLQMTIALLAESCLRGTAVPSIYMVMYDVMNAISQCPERRIGAPTESRQNTFQLADGFTEISKDNILTVYVGCIDGWVCEVRASSADEVPDRYGVSVQAICDSLWRFTGYCFDSPGKMGYSIAFNKWKLSNVIMVLLAGLYIIRDNAYLLSNSLLVLFNNLKIKSKAHYDYNFF
ncbi:LOW QUALITY PROTEIN: hypothetical protein PHMEG_00012413 [Phytophthora megakarya]|uniref:DDE Tnp4 domain-containing protein n=1 Tax=Phytophthora megakarya TaxID=4795 RepID=A0A225W980_9STRA|nr:LOW QUALITY PROTEIN: hypothetical protein PHMEG_00012413 [Phytophthora megakarya]